MDEISISNAQVIALGLSGAINLTGPFVAWAVWRKKTHAAWIPLIAGILGYLVIGTARGVARALLLTDMQDSPWVFYIMQAVFAGVFEECGRYAVMRWGIPNHDQYRDAVSYGIGHGGLEHVILSIGSAELYGFFVALLYRTQGMAAFAPGGAGAFLMEGLDEAGMLEVLKGVSEADALHSLFGIAGAFQLFSICMSVLVCTAVHYDPGPKWLLAAIGLHTVVDIIPALHYAGDFSVLETDILVTLYEIVVIYLTYRVWKHYRPEHSVPAPSLS
ncbi:MAG: YhfC family intramembrane metalloprotease [Oscillospiraceae bacterium]|nr:YhfC family intramembrane metalloprotease [Oscillospiraceae bacterium]